MKRVVCLFLICMIALSGGYVLAEQAEKIRIECKEGVIGVDGSANPEYALREVSLQMIGPLEQEMTLEEAVEKPEINQPGSLSQTVFRQINTEADGTFSYKFYPQENNKFYILAIRMPDMKKPFSVAVLNITEELKLEILQALNAAGSVDDIQMLFENKAYHNALVFGVPVFNALQEEANKEKVYSAVYRSKMEKPFESLEGVYRTIVRETAAVMLINESTDLEVARIAAEENLPLTEQILYPEYREMEEDKRNAVFQRLTGEGFLNPAALLSAFSQAIFLQKLQDEIYVSNLTTLLTEYADVFGINLQGYEKKTNKVNREIYGQYFKTIAELNRAIEKVKPDSDGGTGSVPSGGGGGGGGGKGSGNGYGAPPSSENVTVAEPRPEPDGKVEFSDLSGVPWAEKAIYALVRRGSLSGTGNGKFEPERAVTREEFVKMLVCAFNKDGQADIRHTFLDSQPKDWSYPYIAAALKLGWIKGISETKFGVGESLTRQDMAVILDRILQPEAVTVNRIFTDDSEISSYAKGAVYRLKAAEIIQGTDDGCFEPLRSANRAEAAVLLHRILVQSSAV